MQAVTTQQFLHGDCTDFSLVLSRCMHAGLRHIAHAMQNSAGSEIQRNRTRSGQYEYRYSCTVHACTSTGTGTVPYPLVCIEKSLEFDDLIHVIRD